jgi:protein-L-isoaspartate(D-aspartate) O-methyltransferase
VPAHIDAAIAADRELAEAAREAREHLVEVLEKRLPGVRAEHLDAVREVPRERFVLPADIARSADDTPLPLDPVGNATVSAPHAYLLTYGLLALGPGDHLIELGSGTGYGAALAREMVGPRGSVTTIEIDEELHARAKRLLGADETGTAPGDARRSQVRLLGGDARAVAARLVAGASGTARAPKIAVTYAMTEVPPELERSLPDGARLVAPVGQRDDIQELVLLQRRSGVVWQTSHGSVRYVLERESA